MKNKIENPIKYNLKHKNNMKLVIVESPAKCKKIESYLGPGYKCVASFGHITGILNGLKDIDIANGFKPKFGQLKNKSKYINSLRKAIKQADEIILATDDDREGEAIAWHICKQFKLPLQQTKRIIFNEITKPALTSAIKTPTLVNIDKVNAQQARQVLDLLVGFTISPILWKFISRKSGLSAGRCQTPALRIIYDNANDISKNPGKLVYETGFQYKELLFKLNNHFSKSESVEKFLVSSKKFEHVLKCGAVRENIIKKPPIPLTTSILQQKASNELHFSPKRTMQLAQKLYEGGHITYMRTDSKKYSAKFIKEASKHITSKYGKKYLSSYVKKLCNNVKSKKENNAQEAHEAIRPTKVELEEAGNDKAQQNLYNLIRCITMESCMIPAVYKSICATINSPTKYVYKNSQEQVVEPGWKIVRGYEEQNPNFHYFSTQKKELNVKYSKITSIPTLKDKKMHYTEAKLVQTLEKKGIGRPSTFSSIISKIQDRGYVKKMDVEGKKIKTICFELKDTITKKEEEKSYGVERNKLVMQNTGKIVIEFLIKHFDEMFVYDYTKHMEDDLDKISRGNKNYVELCSYIYNNLSQLSNTIKMDQKQIYKIDDHHTYMIGKYGPVIRKDVDGETTFINVKKDLDMETVKSGTYTLEEMIALQKNSNVVLGKYKNNDVICKKGQYGLYIVCNGKNYSIKHIKKEQNKIKLEDVLGVIESKTGNSNILKKVNDSVSIRKGKYGEYIFYKTESMSKPKFLKLKNILWKNLNNEEILNWIKNEYNI
jgi:DNA topoisomerase I